MYSIHYFFYKKKKKPFYFDSLTNILKALGDNFL